MKWILLILFSAHLFVHASCGASREEKTSGLIIRHTPNPVKATLVKDEGKGTVSYKWTFRTEVINNTSKPLKIVGFSSLSLWGDRWNVGNYTGKEFTNEDFSKWYAAGDSLENGWIPAGCTASDNNNWSTSSWQTNSRTKWQYKAVDTKGNKYTVEEEVFLVPYFEDKNYWEGTDPGELAAIRGTISDNSGRPLKDAQIRLHQFYKGVWREPYDVRATGASGRYEIHAPDSVLCRFFVYLPGYDRLDIPFLLSGKSGDIGIDVVMHREGESSIPQFDDSGRYLERILEVDRQVSAETDSSARAYQEYKKNTRDFSGFRYDWSAVRDDLSERCKNDPEEAVRKYAALQLANVCYYSREVDIETIDWLLKLLPPDSRYWDGIPPLPSYLSIGQDLKDQERILLRFYHESPDRIVRAFALCYLTWMYKIDRDRKNADKFYDIVLREYSDIDDIGGLLKEIDPSAGSRTDKGANLPSFSVTTLDDSKLVSNETYRGNYLLMYFWSTWCGSCKGDMKYLHEAYSRYEDSGLCILSVSFDDDVERVRSFRKERWPLPWDNAVEVQGVQSHIGHNFEVRGLPKIILVNPEGKILKTGGGLRGKKLLPFLEKCIKKS